MSYSNLIFSLLPNYTVQNPLWNKQVCPKFINIIIENNLSRRSVSKNTVCNDAIKVSLLLSHIFIWTCNFFFAVMLCLSATLIYLSISYNYPGIKYETCGVIWYIVPESKIQLVNWELSQKSLLELSSLPDIRSMDSYIFWSLSLSPFSNYLCDA